MARIALVVALVHAAAGLSLHSASDLRTVPDDFERLDTDHDGVISREEFIAGGAVLGWSTNKSLEPSAPEAPNATAGNEIRETSHDGDHDEFEKAVMKADADDEAHHEHPETPQPPKADDERGETPQAAFEDARMPEIEEAPLWREPAKSADDDDDHHHHSVPTDAQQAKAVDTDDLGPSPCVSTRGMSTHDQMVTENRCKSWTMWKAAKEKAEVAKERSLKKKLEMQARSGLDSFSRAAVDARTLEQREAEECRFEDDAWQSYIRLHQDGLEKLQAGSRDVKALVWRCESEDLCGGNTDQLSGLLKTFLLAVQLKRVFLVDWYRSSLDMEELFPHRYIQWKLTDTLREMANDNKTHTSLQGRQGWIGQDERHANIFSENQWVVLHTNMDPNLVDAEKANLDSYRIGCYFHFLFGISKRLEMIVDKRHARVQAKPFVAVHVRLGDWWMDSVLTAKTLFNGSQTVLGTVLDCSRNMSGVDMPVMVYADAYCIKAVAANETWLETRSDNGRVFTTLDSNGEVFVPKHSDDGHNQGLNGETSWMPDVSSQQGHLLDSWADQFGMMRATHLIKTSWSGFSQMAAEIALMRPASVRQLFVRGNMDEIESARCDVLSKKYTNLFW